MIPSVILMLGCAATVAMQAPSQASPRPVTSDGIVAAIGSDADARHVIQLVLANLLAQRSNREFVLASQISANWLPSLGRVEIIRLADTAVDRHLAACGRYWVVFDVNRADNVVSLKVSERCGCSVREYVTSFEDGAWHLGPPRAATTRGGWAQGIGSGCVGPPPGCPCFGRN
jgi:hypothetical protein